MEIRCAQCDRPFAEDPALRACPHCRSMRAGRCHVCGTAIYLGATTCSDHSEAAGGPVRPAAAAPGPAGQAGRAGPGSWAPAPPAAAPAGRAASWPPPPAAAPAGRAPSWPPPPSAPPAGGRSWPPPPPPPPPGGRDGAWGSPAPRGWSAPPPAPYGAPGAWTGTGPSGPGRSIGDVLPAGLPRRRRTVAWRPVAVVVTVVALLAGIGAGVAVLRPRAPGHPKTWDARVTDLVAFVEYERGLTFEHPVRIDFLPDAEFRALATGPAGRTDAAALAEMESQESLLRAMGLVTGDIDLASMTEELHGDGTVGLYDFEDKRIYVRGEVLDDQRRSTLVHELTHALQDQHFGIGRVARATSGAEAAFTAVVEADAELVQTAWVDSLPVSAREALAAAEERAGGSMDFAGVPPVFLEMTSFPYVLGPSFLDWVIDERGVTGRNDVLRSPPTTEEHIILPRAYLDRQAARYVPVPALGPGERAIPGSASDFGMLSLLVLLGERLDFSEAWQAVQGWAGDASIGFERDGRSCVRMKVLFDDPSQAGRFADAFRTWGDGRPARADVAANGVAVESCDPGAGAVPGRAENHLSGIEGFGLRSSLIAAFVEGGASLAGAPCVADGVIARLGADRFISLDAEINEKPSGRGARELERVTAEVARGCPA